MNYKELRVEFTLEQNMPKQSTKPTEGTGNSIQEYLKLQQEKNKNG